MSLTPWIPAVSKVSNNTDVSAEVVNPILEQYAQRTQHLYEKFNTFAGRSILMAYDQPLLNLSIVAGDVVFFNKISGSTGLSLAKSSFSVDDTHRSAFSIGNSSFTCGIVESVSSSTNTANVYLYGMVELSTRLDSPTGGLLVTDETVADIDVETTAFVPGPLYLDNSEAGKLTKIAPGVSVFVAYAISRTSILLAPRVNEFANLFTHYHYNVLDRPAGKPVLSSGTWTISNPDLTKPGWIPAATAGGLGYTVPSGAKFFYNLPSAANVSADTGITTDQQTEQNALALALPPFPTNISMLALNGVIQTSKDYNTSDGIYSLDLFGLWWFSDDDGYQPWSTDITTSLALTVDHTTDTFTCTSHGLENNDKVKLEASVIPTGLSTATLYYVVNKTTNTFQLSTSPSGSASLFSSNGTTVTIPQPYIWKGNRGTDEYRARIYLQFLKLNPDLKSLFVASVAPFNSGNSALKFYSKGTNSLVSSTGDLLARLVLEYLEGSSTNSNKAISGLSYDESTGKTTLALTPIVSQLTGAGGISISENGPNTGKYIITTSATGITGSVDIEPENAELSYTGLHSYLRLLDASVLTTGITGKFRLPATSLSADIEIKLLLFSESSFTSSDTITFDFTYAISKSAGLVNSTVVSSVATISTVSTIAANTCFESSNDAIIIPSSVLAPNAVVNFRLIRKVNSYTPTIGLVETYWKVK